MENFFDQNVSPTLNSNLFDLYASTAIIDRDDFDHRIDDNPTPSKRIENENFRTEKTSTTTMRMRMMERERQRQQEKFNEKDRRRLMSPIVGDVLNCSQSSNQNSETIEREKRYDFDNHCIEIKTPTIELQKATLTIETTKQIGNRSRMSITSTPRSYRKR